MMKLLVKLCFLGNLISTVLGDFETTNFVEKESYI